jgi:hypothetical protein
MSLDFKCAWTAVRNTRAAFDEVREKIEQPAPSCVIFYCSPTHDLDELARAINAHYDCPVMACTTAGEVVPGYGYVDGGLAAASLCSPELRVAQEAILDVRSLDNAAALRTRTRLLERLDKAGPSDGTLFGMLLIDGLCEREEFVASMLYGAFGGIPMIGGSAGEAGQLVETRVFADGRFRQHAAVFTLVRTTLPCLLFKTDHYERSDTRFVVTRADPERRRLLELNGIAPAEYYFEQTGIAPDAFNPVHASRNPLLLPVGTDHYARGVRLTEPDGSLVMFCAIEEGIVLRLGRPLDIVAETERQRRAIASALPNHCVTLGFDCFYRRLEILDRNLRAPMREIIDRLKLFGFNTYGEQYNGLHVNQTLTGVALGAHA